MKTTKDSVLELVEMVQAGNILGAFERFYAEDVVMQENQQPPRHGKAESRAYEEQFGATISQVHENRAATVLVDGDRAAIEWILDFTNHQGQRLRIEQAALQTWRDGQVVHERFFYGQ